MNYLSDGIAAPSGLESVVLAFDFDVGALAVERVRRTKVVEGQQQVQVGLRLRQHIVHKKTARWQLSHTPNSFFHCDFLFLILLFIMIHLLASNSFIYLFYFDF